MADNTDLLADFFSKKKVTLQVVVNLDPIPGAFHTPDDAVMRVQYILDSSIRHYHPMVTLISSGATQDGNAVLRDLLDTLK